LVDEIEGDDVSPEVLSGSCATYAKANLVGFS